MRRLSRLLVICVFLASFAQAKLCTETQEPKRVLILLSYHLGLPVEDDFMTGIREVIDRSSLWMELHFEYMDGKRYPPPLLDTLLDSLLTHKYKQTCFNAIVTADNIAFEYALNRRNTLFRGLPLVFLGVNDFKDSMIENQSNLTGIAEDSDLPGTLDLIQALQPDVRTLYLITDQSETGWKLRGQLTRHMENDPRWEVRWLQQETYRSLLDTLSDPNGKGAALVLAYNVDKEGTPFSETKFFEMIGERTRKPVYVMLGHQAVEGIVGGALLSGRLHGNIAGEMLLSILNGTPADSIPIIRESPKQNQVDYPALLRFGIDPARIPDDTRIERVPFSPWKQYRIHLISVSTVFLFLMACIVILLHMRSQLQKSRQRYRELVDHASTVILHWDTQGCIQFINEYGIQLFGYTLNEMQGRSILNTILPEQTASHQDLQSMVSHFLAQPDTFVEQEQENITKDGRSIWMRWHTRAQYDSEGFVQSLFSVGSDITEKHQRDEDIQRFNRKVAHDLRSPLITIHSFTAMLSEDIAAGDMESVEQSIKYIQHATKRMTEQVEELGQLFRTGETLTIVTQFDIAAAIEEARMAVAGRLQKRQIQVDICACGTLTAERPRFVDIVQNLIDNAAKHIGTQPAPRIAIGSGYRDGKAVIYVRDNGEGIAPKDLERIFDAFVKLDCQTEGFGLGLSFVRSMVENHGGRIWAESAGPGQGATFWLELEHLELPADAPELPVPQ